MSHALNNTRFDPTWTDPALFEPLYGIGKIRATIYLDNDLSLIREFNYSWQITCNGVEVFMESPYIRNASALREDIGNALSKQLKFDVLNFID